MYYKENTSTNYTCLHLSQLSVLLHIKYGLGSFMYLWLIGCMGRLGFVSDMDLSIVLTIVYSELSTIKHIWIYVLNYPLACSFYLTV